MNKELLEVRSLSITVNEVALVNKLSFSLSKGKTLGIVGESGSGKSLTSLAIMGLLPSNLKVKGMIEFNGKNLIEIKEGAYQKLRGKSVSMIFQEPMTALNPSMRCGPQVEEILTNHTNIKGRMAKNKVVELFEKVKLPRPADIYRSYPHQISGGQKQRVMIAMAIACNPELLIADEPTTALDVTVQSDILDLLKELQTEFGMAMLFITHDLGVVKQIADEVMVMYRGKMLEYGSSQKIFREPEHAYTKGLLACRPTAHTNYKRLPLVSDFMRDEKFKPEISQPMHKETGIPDAVNALLEIKNLRKWFTSRSGFFQKTENEVKAVDGVNFKIYKGETLGLVGESGCGKTTLGRILSGLEKADRGEVYYKGKDITALSRGQWKKLHREVQIIFQDPFSSLNPRIPIGKAIGEVLQIHGLTKGTVIKTEVEALLVKVGLEKEHYSRYPHEFSGGQRQRLGIARALALKPEFIVCDESVSALDVSVQAQVINLLNDLKDDFGFTYLFISHDLAVVKYISDRIMVMQSGVLVETGLADQVYNHPEKEYTRKLIASVPEI